MDDSFASISSSVATEESIDNETKSLASKGQVCRLVKIN